MITKLPVLSLTLIAACSFVATLPSVKSQSPPPIIVQAATSASGTNNSPAQSAVLAQDAAAIQVAIQTLEKIKAANDEVLKRQQATLQQLEEIQQAAEELKIFAKRG